MPLRPSRVLLLLVLPALFVSPVAAPDRALAAVCGSERTELGNGGFETPGVAPDSYAIFDASQVPPWNTTDDGNGIEVWGDGFLGVPAFEGGNFAELNANSAGTLFQDVVTTPGATMTWSLHHRGRDGTDVMKVLIGDALVADVSSDAGWNWISAGIADAETVWGAESDTYVVPTGQTCTRFAFRAVGPGSYGNLLDGIGFVVTIPADPTPVPTPVATPVPTPDAVEPSASTGPPPTPQASSLAASPSPAEERQTGVAAPSEDAITLPSTDTGVGSSRESFVADRPTSLTWLIIVGVVATLTAVRVRRVD